MSSSRWVTSCGSRSIRVTSASTSRRVEGGRPAGGPTAPGPSARARSRRSAAPSGRPGSPRRVTTPSARDDVRPTRGDGLVGLGLRVRATPSMASSAFAWVAATAAMAASALAWVATTPSTAASALAWMATTPSIAASARAWVRVQPVDGLVGAVDHARPRGSAARRPGRGSSSIRPTAEPTRGTSASASATPSRTPVHGGNSRRVPGPTAVSRRRTLRTRRWPTIRLRPAPRPVGGGRSAARPAWCPR